VTKHIEFSTKLDIGWIFIFIRENFRMKNGKVPNFVVNKTVVMSRKCMCLTCKPTGQNISHRIYS